jgi:rRNA pseudouridine-1189 N-methylase Emg1 (Nep1/Mra1 family)
MKFIIDEVDINFERIEIKTCYDWKYRGRIVPRFYFTTDKFISVSLIAKLKFNNDFIAMLKDKCSEAIEQMSEEDFLQIQESIRNIVSHNYTKDNNNKMHFIYGNFPRGNTSSSKIYFEDTLSNYATIPETRQDMINALLHTTSRDISRD